jgi:outer membrane lipoprotein-sorting protein
MKRLILAGLIVVTFAPGSGTQTPTAPVATPAAPAAPDAPREAKNVQLLKDLTPGQLVRTMQFMSASLGVTCDKCHVAPVNGERDFASDDKEDKKIARKMIQLVMDTNAKFFDGRPQVSCNTCHRGNDHPVGVPALPIAMAVPHDEPVPGTTANATPAAPATPKRDEIVAKYAAALGKAGAASLSTMQAKGVRETSRGNGPFIVTIAPGKVRVTNTTPDGEMVNVVNGTTGWARDQRGTREMQQQQIDTTLQTVDAYRITLPSEIPAEARVGRDKIGEKSVYVLTIPFGTKGRQRLYFDATSGLLVRRITYTASPVGNIPQQTDFDDYRDAGGVKLPFVVRIDTIDPRGGATRRYSEITLNPKIDEKMFVQ